MALNSVQQAYRSPYMWRLRKAFGIDDEMSQPELMDALLQVVVSFDAPMFTKTIPAGATTYAGEVTFPAQTQQSDRIYLRLNAPGIVLGTFYSVSATIFPPPFGASVPGLDDILVQVDFNREQDYFIARQTSNPTTTGFIPFATLTSQDIRNRLLMQLMPDIDAELGFTFTTRYASAVVGSGVGIDILIHVDVSVKTLCDYNADRLLPQ